MPEILLPASKPLMDQSNLNQSKVCGIKWQAKNSNITPVFVAAKYVVEVPGERWKSCAHTPNKHEVLVTLIILNLVHIHVQ